jgi:hypothetical protein
MDRVTAANLDQKIDEHVIEGLIVVTDDFRGYQSFREEIRPERYRDAVFIMSIEVLKQLEQGDFHLIPIRFPKRSISAIRQK